MVGSCVLDVCVLGSIHGDERWMDDAAPNWIVLSQSVNYKGKGNTRGSRPMQRQI